MHRLVALLAVTSAAITAVAVPAGAQDRHDTPDPWFTGQFLLEEDGTMYGFAASATGDAFTLGGDGGAPIPVPVGNAATAISVATPTGGGGAWVLSSDGRVYGYGNAEFHGHVDMGRLAPGERLTAIIGHTSYYWGRAIIFDDPDVVQPQGDGYWVFTDRGRVFAFGNAPFYGDVSSLPLNGPVIAAAATATEQGYYLVASDGGVFSFGDATFEGSMGGRPLNEPVVGMATDPDGTGYWLIAADGGIFAFDAPFRGSIPGHLSPGVSLNRPVIGGVPHGDGYLMVASDGGVFNFSSHPFAGSLGATQLDAPVVDMAGFEWFSNLQPRQPMGMAPTTPPPATPPPNRAEQVVLENYLDAVKRRDTARIHALAGNDDALELLFFDRPIGECWFGPTSVLCEAQDSSGDTGLIGAVVDPGTLLIVDSFWALGWRDDGLGTVEDVWRGAPGGLMMVVLEAFANDDLRSMNRYAIGAPFQQDDAIGTFRYIGDDVDIVLPCYDGAEWGPAADSDAYVRCVFNETGIQVSLEIVHLPHLGGWVIWSYEALVLGP